MLYRILLTIGLIVGVLVAAALVRGASRLVLRGEPRDRSRFWIAQATHLLALCGIAAVIIGVWVAANTRELGTVSGWFAAGLTIALQRVVTAFAGYVIILRGNIFTVGDRITMDNVRGDVVALGFMQTTVMEMGQSPPEQGD